MRTNLEVLPLNHIRQWFPVQDMKRALAWALLIALVTVLACLALNVTQITIAFGMFAAGLYLAMQAQRLMIPARPEVEGMSSSTAWKEVNHILTGTSGGKYVANESKTGWKYVKNSLLYAWDPVIRVEIGTSVFTIVGPRMLLASIEQSLHKDARA